MSIAMLRPVRHDDFAYIFSTIMPSVWLGNPFFKKIKRNIFLPHYRVVIDSIIENPKTQILIAAFNEDDSLILGYSIFQDDTLHYVYVKGAYRNRKIATLLLENFKFNKVTHYTNQGEWLKLDAELDPFTLLQKDENGTN